MLLSHHYQTLQKVSLIHKRGYYSEKLPCQQHFIVNVKVSLSEWQSKGKVKDTCLPGWQFLVNKSGRTCLFRKKVAQVHSQNMHSCSVLTESQYHKVHFSTRSSSTFVLNKTMVWNYPKLENEWKCSLFML